MAHARLLHWATCTLLAAGLSQAHAEPLASIGFVSPKDLLSRHAHNRQPWTGNTSSGQCDEEVPILDFPDGTEDIGAAGRASINAAIYALGGGACAVTIAGYASLSGSPSVNKSISTGRANQVADYIASLGEDLDVQSVLGYGATDRFGPDAADNRRVVITFGP